MTIRRRVPGPRQRHRQRRADELATSVAQIRPGLDWVGPILAELAVRTRAVRELGGLNAQEARGELRRSVFADARQQARTVAQNINALQQDEVIPAVAGAFVTWGREYQDPALERTDDPLGLSYKCYRPDSGASLLAAGNRLTNLLAVTAPNLPDYADAAATTEAVDRMLSSARRLLPFSIDSSGFSTMDDIASADVSAQTEALAREALARIALEQGDADATDISPAGVTALAQGLTPDDMLPLFTAIIVDALLFLFTILDRPGPQADPRPRLGRTSSVRHRRGHLGPGPPCPPVRLRRGSAGLCRIADAARSGPSDEAH